MIQEKILIFLGFIYNFILGAIVFRVTLLFINAVFHTFEILAIVTAPFIIVMLITALILFIKSLDALFRFVLRFQQSKFIFTYEEKLAKTQKFIQTIPEKFKFKKTIYIAFFIYWFLFLTIFTLLSLHQKNYQLLIVLIPFIIVGMVSLRTFLLQK